MVRVVLLRMAMSSQKGVIACVRLASLGLCLAATTAANALPSAPLSHAVALLPTYLDFIEAPSRHSAPLGRTQPSSALLRLPNVDLESMAKTASACGAETCDMASSALRFVYDLHRWTLFTRSSIQSSSSGTAVHWVRIIPTKFSNAYGITAQAAF